jgi:hypothetical protein
MNILALKARHVLIVILLFIFPAAHGQLKSMDSEVRVGIVGIQGVRTLTHTDNLNTVFKTAGYPGIKSTISYSQAGVGLWANRWYILAIQSNYQSQETARGNFVTSISGDGFDLLIAYAVLRSTKIRFYPYMGVGFSNYAVNIDPVNPPLISSLLGAPISNSIPIDVKNENCGSIGLGLDYRIASLFKNMAALSIAAMGGYYYGASGQWRVNSQLASDPQSSLSGLDGKLAIQLFFKLGVRDAKP